MPTRPVAPSRLCVGVFFFGFPSEQSWEYVFNFAEDQENMVGVVKVAFSQLVVTLVVDATSNIPTSCDN